METGPNRGSTADESVSFAKFNTNDFYLFFNIAKSADIVVL